MQVYRKVHLTLNVRGQSYPGLTRSISWLLMPRLLTSPGHQQPWYVIYVGPCLTRGRIPATCGMPMWRKDIHCKYMFIFLLKNSARKGSNKSAHKASIIPLHQNTTWGLCCVYKLHLFQSFFILWIFRCDVIQLTIPDLKWQVLFFTARTLHVVQIMTSAIESFVISNSSKLQSL